MDSHECVLSTRYVGRSLLDVLSGDGEKPSPVVQFNVSPSVSAFGEFAFDEHMIAGSRRRDFCIGVEPFDDVLGSQSRPHQSRDRQSSRSTPTIGSSSVTNPHAIGLPCSGVFEGDFETSPCLGVSRRCEPTTSRSYRYFCCVAISLSFLPADPLFTFADCLRNSCLICQYSVAHFSPSIALIAIERRQNSRRAEFRSNPLVPTGTPENDVLDPDPPVVDDLVLERQ